MATRPQDVKKQLESIAGHQIHVEPELLQFSSYPVGAYDYADGYVAAHFFLKPGFPGWCAAIMSNCWMRVELPIRILTG